MGFPSGLEHNLPAVQETWVRFLGQEDLLEKGMATHSSVLAWKIPWAEKPGGLQSMGSQRVRHDWATNTFIYMCVYIYTYVHTYIHIHTYTRSRCFKVKYGIKYASLPLKILATNKFIWEAKTLLCECRDLCMYLNFCLELYFVKSSFALLRNFSCLRASCLILRVSKILLLSLASC